eukprot:CAMPEP_0183363816 /NCGR_PEP_ID=MMETSP0164_2-20130417/76922_1 /TAXON_ID=221442 /ORGANISM="Coccolithus pelagicus ssp braarudi, Strain PLY182g" /LENGTH=281 /DNA_ID=CAMNT_0025538987 /DNA_START=162 /DNA_END=1008 /DNA_ORIENTATION=+
MNLTDAPAAIPVAVCAHVRHVLQAAIEVERATPGSNPSRDTVLWLWESKWCPGLAQSPVINHHLNEGAILAFQAQRRCARAARVGKSAFDGSCHAVMRLQTMLEEAIAIEVVQLVAYRVQVAAVDGLGLGGVEATGLPLLVHLDVDEARVGQQPIAEGGHLVADPDEEPHDDELEGLLFPLVASHREVPIESFEEGAAREAVPDEPEPRRLARIDGAPPVLVHAIHPAAIARNLVVRTQGKVGGVDIREALQIKGAIPAGKGIGKPRDIAVGEDEVVLLLE